MEQQPLPHEFSGALRMDKVTDFLLLTAVFRVPLTLLVLLTGIVSNL